MKRSPRTPPRKGLFDSIKEHDLKTHGLEDFTVTNQTKKTNKLT